MPDLHSLKLALDNIHKTPVSTPTARSEGSPARHSGSGVSRTQRSNSPTLSHYSDTASTYRDINTQRSTLLPSHSQHQSLAYWPPEDHQHLKQCDETDEQLLLGTHHEAEEEHKESTPEHNEKSQHSTAATLPPLSPTTVRKLAAARKEMHGRLVSALLASRQLRDGYTSTQHWLARRTGKDHYDLTMQPPGRQLQLLRAALSHDNAKETKEELLQRRQQRRQWYKTLVADARHDQSHSLAHTAPLRHDKMHHISPPLQTSQKSTPQYTFLTQSTSNSPTSTPRPPPPQPPKPMPPPKPEVVAPAVSEAKVNVRKLMLDKAKREKEAEEALRKQQQQQQSVLDEAERVEQQRRQKQQDELQAQLMRAKEDEEKMRRVAEERKRREQAEREEEEKMRIKEEEKRRVQEEEELMRRKEQEGQEHRRLQDEAEQRRKKEREEEERRMHEEDTRKRQLEEQRRRGLEEERNRRIVKENDEKRVEEEAERHRRETQLLEQETKRRFEEENQKRQAKAEDEERRKKEEAEQARKQAAEAQAAADLLEAQKAEDEVNKQRQAEAEAVELDRLRSRLQGTGTGQRSARQSLSVPPPGTPKVLPPGLQSANATPLLQARRTSLMRTPSSHLSRSLHPSRRSSFALPPPAAAELPSPETVESPLAAEAEQPLPPIDTAQPAPSDSIGWITDDDRDGLFDYLANEADVFVSDLQLTNAALDALLSTGGSRDETIRLCRLVDAQHHQVETVEQLQAAMVEQRKPVATPVAAQLQATAWITAADRDALFDFLASDTCGLFSADVKLNNRTLDSIMAPAGSVDVALRLLAAMDEAQLSFDSSDALVGAMKAATLALPATSAAAAEAAPVESSQPILADATSDNTAGDNSTKPAKSEPQLSAALPTTAAEETKQSDISQPPVLSVSTTQVPTQLPIEATSSVGNSAITPAEVEQTVVAAELVAPTSAVELSAAVPQLATAIQPIEQQQETTTSIAHPVLAAIKVQQPQPRRPSNFSFQAEDLNLAPPATTNAVPLPLSSLPPTHTWMTDSDRDQLYAYLSLPTTSIFSQPTQITPAMLDAMLVATGSVYTCIEVLSALQKRHLLFPYIQPLLFALQREMAQLTNQPATQPTQQQQQQQQRPQSPHTENRASRDALFAYLSSTSCHLFHASVKLNNFTLDRLLYGGRGLACALACCHCMDEQGRQFGSVEELLEALRVVAGQREEQEAALLAVLSHPQHQRNLFGASITVSPNDVKQLWLSVQAGSDTMAYLLMVEEDQLSGKGRTQLSSVAELRHEIQRRHSTMRLERRKEMERLYEFMHLPARRCLQPGSIVSMEQCAQLAMAGREDLRPDHSTQAMRLIGEVEGQQVQCQSIDELVKRVVEQRKRMGAAGMQPAANAAVGQTSRQPKPAGATWVTAKDRDALFDYLASEECSLFNANVKLNNKALDSLLLAGTSLQRTLDISRSLDANKAQHSTIQQLRDAIAAKATTDSAPQPANSAVAAVPAISTAAVAPQKTARVAVSAADRDAVFDVLAEETDLFSKDVKLSNKALDSLIQAAGSKDNTINRLRALDKQQQKFDSIATLATALRSAESTPPAVASKDRDDLFAWLASDDCRLFDAAVPLNDDALNALLTAGKSLALTLDTLQRVQVCQLQFSSHQPLLPVLAAVASMPTPAAQPSTFSAADRDTLFEYLASDSCNVFSDNVKLSNSALDRLLAAGRGVEAVMSILRQINVSTRQVGSVQALADVIIEEWAAGVAAWTDLVIYFASPAAADLLATPPTAVELLSFIWQTETGSDTLWQVRSLPTPSAPYPSVAAVLPLVSSARVSTLLSTNDDIATLHALLAGRDGGGSTQRLALLSTDAVSLYDCWRIAKAGRVGVERSVSVGVVNELDKEGKRFSTVDELVAAVAKRTAQKQSEQSTVVAVKPTRS